jgi:hypothetical protein
MQLVRSANNICFSAYALSSYNPYENTKPNNSIRSQLMHVYLKLLQNIHNHLVHWHPKASSEETSEDNNLITLRLWGRLVTSKTNVALVQKGSKPAGTIYFYRRFRLSTDCVISSGGSLRKPPLEIVFLLAVP